MSGPLLHSLWRWLPGVIWSALRCSRMARHLDRKIMETRRTFVATIRCQTWNTWPEYSVSSTGGMPLETLPGGLDSAAVSYHRRSMPHEYFDELASDGPLLWRGQIPGRYIVRGAILVDPQDIIKVKVQLEHARKGEVDVCVFWTVPDVLPPGSEDFLAARAWALLALLNLRLGEYLTPVAPVQIGELTADGRTFENQIPLQAQKRHALSQEQVVEALREFPEIATDTTANSKLCTALELYGAHFSEASAKVRFLLLVMSLEALTEPTPKDEPTQYLLDKWKQELETEKQSHAKNSAVYESLLALERELFFRRQDSIRSQLRKLMQRVPTAHADNLPRRALRLYDKRSSLVHDGSLPSRELKELELEAAKLVEAALTYHISTRTAASGENASV